jgi:hypothetical protein
MCRQAVAVVDADESVIALRGETVAVAVAVLAIAR